MERVQIIWVARSYTGPSGAVKAHKHSYYHMFYICSGTIRITIAGKSHELERGCCILVPKDTEHFYTNIGSENLEYLEIKFSCLTPALDDRLMGMGTMISQEPLAGELTERIVQEYLDHNASADEAAAHYLLALLYAQTVGSRTARQMEFRYIDAGHCKPLIQQVVQYLEEHFAESFSLDTVAQAVGRNKSYLCTVFLKETGTTILDCLNTIRVRHAAELITYSDYSLTNVSTMCGFASTSHFSRIFVKYAGVTPGQCRKAYPDNILVSAESWAESNKVRHPNRFIYNVLAHKRITLDMMHSEVRDE